MMTVFLIILGALVTVGLLLRFTHRADDPPAAETEVEEEPATVEEECCGQHQVCERESLLAAVSRGIEYFDDEELDRYRGRAADGYTDAEADEFRQIMLTMREDEVAAWARSLQLRAVELPMQLRDELLLLVSELRR
ncbi:MAG: phospholipase [Muribaculaceae bacterium]|nr:phospholipase [Muribaculaceae bacterium]